MRLPAFALPVAVPLAVLALCAGCSGGSTPRASQTSASASPSPSDTPAGTPSPSASATASAVPTASASPQPPRGTPSCRDSDVRLTVGQGQHTAGSDHQPLVVVVSRTCQLEGAPTVVVLDSLGAVIAGPAGGAGGAGSPVVLTAGQAGYALLNIADADAYPVTSCVPRQGARIRVTLPGGGAPITVADAFRVCTRSGNGQLHVEPFRPGRGE